MLPPPEERFYANVIAMTGLIRKIVVDVNNGGYKEITPAIVDLATKYIQNHYDKVTLIENFIHLSHQDKNINTWDMIYEKNEQFFEKNAFTIFQGIPDNFINAFRKLYTYKDSSGKRVINEKDRETIISYFQAFVRISIKYIHGKRDPYIKEENGKIRYIYKNPIFMPMVDVLASAKKWGIKLEFQREL